MKVMTFARVLACGSSLALAAGLATVASASEADVSQGLAHDQGMQVEDHSTIVVRDGIDLNTPPPGGAYDSLVNLTGVGQMAVRADPNTFSLGLCTGTLINPRTVIFAAHCVNTRPADAYGQPTGGVPISFGFQANNLPAVRQWLGLDGGTLYATNEALALYNVEQVWYDRRSLPTGFLEADIALATLDTHAGGIPTWAMLFSPLTEETHAIVNGYGARGVGANGANLGIDFRRRVAENMLSALMSLDLRNDILFGGPPRNALPQNLYMLDFDSPAGEAAYDPSAGRYDFDLFDGGALPREGTTAGGDSGGHLYVDEKYDREVLVGVLSGGSRFFAGQPFSSYGTSSFYQPVFMFWESIVANNPYAYVSANPGDSNWNNKFHWTQDMDPNYVIDVDGELVNALPGFDEPGVTDETPIFGTVCFLDDCVDSSGLGVPLDEGDPNSVYVPGGPGTTRFVPDNVVADPGAGIKARYYEVTLANEGATNLTDAKTIDRLNISGPARLRVRNDGDLKVWGDLTMTGGVLEIEQGGLVTTGEAFMGKGILQGNGTFDPTFLTNVAGLISPGEVFRAGTLTIKGDVVLASGSTTLFNLEKNRSDLLRVQADDDNTGAISLGGLAFFLPGKFQSPVFGRTYTIVEAEGGVQNTFDATFWLGLGVLYPELTYDANTVMAEMKAQSFSSFLANAGVQDNYAQAFGNVFDALRTSNYAQLSGVFENIDMLGAADLTATFRNNGAALAGDLSISNERENSFVRRLVSDRLGVMGQPSTGGTMRIIGDTAGFTTPNVARSSASQLAFAQSYGQRDMKGVNLPESVSGFISAGYRRLNDAGADTGGRDEGGTWHMAMGLEIALDDRNAMGTAFAYSRGERSVGGSLAQMATSHAAIYASRQLGGGAYVGGQASMAHTALDAASSAPITGAGFALDSRALSYAGEVEMGYNHRMGGLTLTPRTRLEYSSYAIDGFQDRASALGMDVDGIERAGLDWRTGLRLTGSTPVAKGGWTLNPEVQMDYVKRLSGNETMLDLRFLEAESLGVAVPVALHDASYGEVRGGVTVTNGRLSFGAAIEKQIGQDFYRDDRGVVSVSYAF